MVSMVLLLCFTQHDDTHVTLTPWESYYIFVYISNISTPLFFSHSQAMYDIISIHQDTMICLLIFAMVQTGSQELNHPEFMRNYPMTSIECSVEWEQNDQ